MVDQLSSAAPCNPCVFSMVTCNYICNGCRDVVLSLGNGMDGHSGFSLVWRLDGIRAVGILGITLEVENEILCLHMCCTKVTILHSQVHCTKATAVERGDSQVPHPNWGRWNTSP